MNRWPNAAVQQLDLASLDSVLAAAAKLRADYCSIGLLINTARVMYTPESHTAHGFEFHLGTNHLVISAASH